MSFDVDDRMRALLGKFNSSFYKDINYRIHILMFVSELFITFLRTFSNHIVPRMTTM